MIKIAVSGCCGRMGARIVELASKTAGLKVVVALENKGHNNIGAALKDVRISDNPQDIKDADVLIEFTNPEATVNHLDLALAFKKPIVIGTTGLTDIQKTKVKAAAKVIPVLFSPNMSVGVNVLFKLVKDAAENLSADYTANIIEAHHVHKKDAPSGTAKKLAQIIKEVTGKEPCDIKSIREGEIIGDHRVVFEGSLDKIEISHSAKTRDIFAQGALEAAKWVVKQRPGLYDMQDVIRKSKVVRK